MKRFAKKDYLIKVTKQDISKGTPGDGNFCPVARGISRVVPAAMHPFCVEGDFVTNRHWEAILPKKVERFIDRFDTLQPVKPFTFILKPRSLAL